ncbi:hypothetical protein VKS41_000278 [Umbelopsis sp. WA50703]
MRMIQMKVTLNGITEGDKEAAPVIVEGVTVAQPGDMRVAVDLHEAGAAQEAAAEREIPYAAAARYIDTEFFPTKIYIGDLVGVDKYQLEDAFSPYGQIEDIKTVAGKDFAFITYDHPENALYAIKRMDGVRLGRYRIKVNRAKIPERNRVGFGNVPWKDEDGVVAEEESIPDRQPRIGDLTQPLDPRAIGGGRQVLSYDDL